MDPMNDAAIERDIERTLAVDPSPEFLARVRTRIAEEPSPASRRFGWRFAVVATAAVAASVVALLMLRPDQRVEPASGLLMSRSLTSSIVVPTLSQRLAGERRTTNVEPRTTNVEPRTTNVEPRTTNVEPRTTNIEPRTLNVERRTSNDERSFPVPLFDARETRALQRLIAGVRDARVDLTPLLKEAPMALQSLDELVIPAITIEPLVPGGVEGERP
jgi:hypothetical protein